jgi:hypothetical protein
MRKWNAASDCAFPNSFLMRFYHWNHCLPIYLWLYSPCLPWPLFQFRNLYTVGRTPWTGDQSIGGRFVHTEQHKHRINAHRRPCLEWDSDLRSQYSSGRRPRGQCDRRNHSLAHRISLFSIFHSWLHANSSIFCQYQNHFLLYRLSQEERSRFWEVIVPVILSKNVYSVHVHCTDEQHAMFSHQLKSALMAVEFKKCVILGKLRQFCHLNK